MALCRDFRKLDPATQAELRRVAVAMAEAGKTRVEAAAAVGVNRRFVGEWVEAARRSGDAALDGGQRVAAVQASRSLSRRGRSNGSGDWSRTAARIS
jgi:transposase